MTIIVGGSCGCLVVGISMNLGFSGPMEERGEVVVKERAVIDVDGRHREIELSELLAIDGGILSRYDLRRP